VILSLLVRLEIAITAKNAQVGEGVGRQEEHDAARAKPRSAVGRRGDRGQTHRKLPAWAIEL
jgi:hypothetical protein